jgi:probable phosphoglycerate mutase
MSPTAPPPHASLPARRRIYLMRHGSVDYYRRDSTVTRPEDVPLNALGQAQAAAAGCLFAESGVRFDRVLTSGLPRTTETAQCVLAATGQALDIERDERLQEIRGGAVSRIAPEALREAFLGTFAATGDAEPLRFLGGESIGELLDRALPAFEDLLADTSWQCLLLVLHGGVNRALLSRALTGGRAFFGRLEQAPACINVLDVGAGDLVLRSLNLSPLEWLQAHARHTSMELLLAQYLQLRGA